MHFYAVFIFFFAVDICASHLLRIYLFHPLLIPQTAGGKEEHGIFNGEKSKQFFDSRIHEGLSEIEI
jgi:hypothetical protein